MTQPGGGCFRCPQVSKTLLKLTIRHPADQAAAEPAVSTSSANHIPHPPAMRVGRHRRFLQLPHPSPLHLLPDLSLPSGEQTSHGSSSSRRLLLVATFFPCFSNAIAFPMFRSLIYLLVILVLHEFL